MNYHRFESILATASPLGLPSPSSSSSSPCGLIQDVTTTDGLPEEAATGHDNDSFQPHQPFRRAHSMRASFTSLRGLRTRLKQPPTVAATKYNPLLSPGRCSVSTDHHQQQHQHQHPAPTLTTTAAAVAKANVKAKLLRLKETYAEFRRMQSSSSSHVASTTTPTLDLQRCSANFKIPENMPPKAAAVLLEGGSSARTAGRRAIQRTQSLKVAAAAEPPRYGAIIGGGGSSSLLKRGTGSGKLTVRKTASVPLEEQKKQQQQVAEDSSGEDKDGQCLKVARTATIRRSSVWANSSSSSKTNN